MENAVSNSSLIYRESKRNVLIATVAVTAVSTFASVWFEKNSSIDQIITFLTTIGYGFLILLWCNLDSRERNENLGAGFRLLLVIFGVFALIFYLFRSRGFKKGFVSLGYALLFFLGLIVVNIIIAIILEVVFQT